MPRLPVSRATRTFLGGLSEEKQPTARRAASGKDTAPRWTTAAAILMQDALQHVAEPQDGCGPETAHAFFMLLVSPARWAAWAALVAAGGCKRSVDVAMMVMSHWRDKIARLRSATDADAWCAPFTVRGHVASRQVKVCVSDWKRWTDKVKARREPLAVDAPPHRRRTDGPKDWIDLSVGKRRQLKPNGRVDKIAKRWGVQDSHAGATVAFERAIAKAKGKTPSAARLDEIVYTTRLPTAIKSGADCYYLLGHGFWTAGELASSLDVPDDLPLREAIRGAVAANEITERQACMALGEAVHAGVVEEIIRALVADGGLPPGPPSYGSAFSGFDLFAAAMDRVFRDEWWYCFASEIDPQRRAVLRRAWAHVGLEGHMIEANSTGEAAVAQPRVDIFTMGPRCQAFSSRNHSPDEVVQAASLADVSKAAEYIRRAGPRCFIIENVNTPDVVGPVWAILRALKGYRVEGGVLDPRLLLDAAVDRERHYWVGRHECGPEGYWGVDVLPDDPVAYPWMG